MLYRTNSAQPACLLAALWVALAALLASPALAEEPPPGGVTVTIAPYAWGSSLGGDVGLLGLSGNFHLPFSDIFEDLDAVAMGKGEIAAGRWAAFVNGQHVKTSKAPTLLGLLPLDIRVKTNRLELGMYYKAMVRQRDTMTVFDRPQSVSFGPILGARYTDLEVRTSALGLSVGGAADWVEPFVGVRVDADLSRRWNVSASTDLGGIGSSSKSSVNAEATLGYKVRPFGQPVVLNLGYRYLRQNYSHADFTGRTNFVWRVEQQGPIAGFSMVF